MSAVNKNKMRQIKNASGRNGNFKFGGLTEQLPFEKKFEGSEPYR